VAHATGYNQVTLKRVYGYSKDKNFALIGRVPSSVNGPIG
jgi:hypothetical protein